MFTTEEKVNLLKKCQRIWLRDGWLDNLFYDQLNEAKIVKSFDKLNLANKQPQDITQFDIVAEER